MDLSRESGCAITFGSLTRRESPGLWRELYDIIAEGNRRGARVWTQVQSREINTVLSFETQLPFDNWPVWREFRAQSLAEQKAALQDPEMRAKLAQAARGNAPNKKVTGGEARPPEWDWFYYMDKAMYPHRTLADIAKQRGVEPIEAFLDICVETDLKAFFRQPIANEIESDALQIMKDPNSVVTFSDSGAHVSQIMDSSLQTHLLSYWVREKQEFSLRASGQNESPMTPRPTGAFTTAVCCAKAWRPMWWCLIRTISSRKCRPWNTTCRPARNGSSKWPTGSRRPSSTAKRCCATMSIPGPYRASYCEVHTRERARPTEAKRK